MSQPDMLARLNVAIALIDAGRRDEARHLLHELSTQYPDVAAIWLWLATVTEEPAERISYLNRVLEIEPGNSKARAALAKLGVEPAHHPESSPIESPTSGGGVPRGKVPLQNIEAVVTAVLALVVLVLVVFIVSTVVASQI
ncbi:MAG TPA: hypothetical protein VMT34_16580, partial [Aggregatilineales bacterium]|nr:hypothetical protein [Aggregatilineales bacterium]